MKNILGIVTKEEGLVVQYDYTAYGELKSISGSLASTIGVINPFRYKGYYYDVETNMFYCKSRYYNPLWCRFINIDSARCLDTENINGMNLYCYCMNNPVMLVDENGDLPKWAKVVIGVGTVVALAALTIATGGATTGLIGAVSSIASGALAGSLVNGITTLATGIITGDSDEKIINDTFDSIIEGAIIGGISGFLGSLQFKKNAGTTSRYLTNYFSQVYLQGTTSMVGSYLTGASPEETAISAVFAIAGGIAGVKDGSKVNKLTNTITTIGINAGEIVSNILNIF